MLEFLRDLKKRPVRVVFVCTANCCRSPLAEILFEKIVSAGHPEHQLLVESAATSFSGYPIASHSARVLTEEEGVNPRRCAMHRGRHLSEIDPPSLLLTMTTNHKREICQFYPDWSRITFTLEEFAYYDSGRPARDIADPLGGSEIEFSRIKNQIKEALLLLYEECRQAGLLEA